jgi:PAS domain S-box-containing protein
VDDDVHLAEVLGRLLHREGYQCTIADGPAQARARLAETEFAVALVDVMMPGESGLELMVEMLAEHPDLAVVMVTGVDDPRVAELALEAGAYGYVVKPFRPSQVLITVANAGRRRCLEIMRRRHEARLEQHIDEQAVDLDAALHQLKEAHREVALSPGEDVVFQALASAATLRALFDASPDALLSVDGDACIKMVNTQVERLSGYGRDELLGRRIDVLVPQGIDAVVQELGARPADSAPRRVGVTLRRADGSELAAELRLGTVEHDGGVLMSAVVTPAHQGAKDVHGHLAAIVESSHDAILGKTLDGVITTWNPGAERIYGYTAAEMLGRRGEEIIPEDLRDYEFGLLERIARGERVEQYRTQRTRRDGCRLSVAMTVSPITDADGTIVGVASVSRDLSERVRADALLLSVLDAAPDGMVCIDAQGLIVMANAQAERLLGYRRGKLVGQPSVTLLPDRERAHYDERLAAFLIDPSSRPAGSESEVTVVRQDGSQFPAEISASTIQTDDGLLVTAAIRDITERLEIQAERQRLEGQAERESLESQLHQSQRLESLGQLAGGVAHDFNNLLAVILNYTAFISDEVTAAAAGHGGEHWEQVRQDVNEVQRAAERAARLTHQLLTFSRREVVQPEVLHLNAVVTDIQQLLERSIGEHVELSTTLAPDLWPVMADPGQIEQVLVNLAVNARDAMTDGGTLTIATENATIDEPAALDGGPPPGRYVQLRVSDTGEGMEPEVLARAYEPFYTTKPSGEGSGLGLATVHGIITQAGGHAHITSDPGIGTVFTALLPATDELYAPPMPTPQAKGPRPQGGGTILVVEDEPAMREVTRRILTRNSYHVLTAADGDEAIALAAAHDGDIDLLLTDVFMPHMLGREVADRVAAIRPGIRILYMSGYAQPFLASRGTLDEGITLIEKPFTEPELLAKIDATLQPPPPARQTPPPADSLHSTPG